MSSSKNIQIIRYVVILLSFSIVSLILWNTYTFFQKFKEEERAKMEVIASALEMLASTSNLEADIELPLQILNNNKSIPMIWADVDNAVLDFHNLDSIKALKTTYLNKQLQQMASENEAIHIEYVDSVGDVVKQYIYYRNSDLLNKLKYYPLALILILFLFASVIFLFFKSNKIAEQNKLWTGMAKETAHQIGTPLSSLLGWIEILRMENTDESTVKEIENDVFRLNTIAERFSKIGSIPTLKQENVVEITKTAFEYLKSRSSKQTSFTFNTTNNKLFTNLNAQLFAWVIENLIKNALDAMNGKGSIKLTIDETEKHITILISDTGKGIPKQLQQKIFNPGYTTKKRGWGLGLSLAKRIIEDYHNGKINVLKSEVNVGTTFKILLKK
ncbi:HAMP domain-containing sensor histidine kinase [Lutibacter sp. TH_r2]|uniref:sensor histidine kinase n=1 Tax=Lutibacter sp. TH_r2 TaxID=3082083 RepID=UPI00295305D0|nr:HAMP domain-containing sensor histidine kinase [Lutibacter sp. TH_r2]MDV7186967.1 HAMP domain-containing sensor histidine kinase [Lutibacter sp. TH_r2]